MSKIDEAAFRKLLFERIARLPERKQRLAARAALAILGDSVAFVKDKIFNFREFIRYAWPYVEGGTKFSGNWHVDCIADHLEALFRCEIRNLVICVPPRSGKSIMCCVLFPAWAFSVDPTTRFIFASYSIEFARRDANKTRDLMTTEWYRSMWGDRVQIKPDQRAAFWFHTTAGGFRLATSPGGLGIGEGADIIIVDDPHKQQDIYSDTKRGRVISWWKDTMSSRYRDAATFRKLVVQQRLAVDDLAGFCINEGYEALILPMEYDGVRRSTSLGAYDPRTEEGELLWPDRVPKEEVESIKRSVVAYEAQYQQNPRVFAEVLMPPTIWKFWRHDVDEEVNVELDIKGYQVRTVAEELPRHLDRYVISWDTAASASRDADASVGQLWAAYGEKMYLIDMVKGRWSPQNLVDKIYIFAKKHPEAYRVYIEETPQSRVIMEMFRSKYQDVKLTPVPPGVDDKFSRFLGIYSKIDGGNVYLPKPSYYKWVTDFIVECLQFGSSASAAHDDQVDAMVYAISQLSSRRKLACVW
ncbi:MAG: phage terminase large subunit [Candidatus Bilamarchaeaceae archaeon]